MTQPSPRAESELPEFLGGAADDITRAPARAATTSQGHIPGEAGLWIFLFGDMTIFAAILLAFLWDRRADVDGFKDASHQLIQPIGAVNTLVLLLSSYLVVRALFAHRADRHVVARRLIAGAMACAAVFAGLKAVEYYAEISAGHTPATGQFFTFYFILTGLHLLHVVIGTALLGAWQLMCRRRRAWSATQRVVEGTASYWHMVDLLWVAIFAIAYLVSAE
ncbi:cytochrome c oxidase subunit 3 [Mycobacterium sp. AT1]|uniref:cytochrome c oxidase subunit 3 n=1 Tax=Mycobacterium sp. AT1 TaxID=1961706 RepID=UPI0009AE77C6|nr:cytochrome c oxidase subunit 3 [Mycobacterium sp. AT1]